MKIESVTQAKQSQQMSVQLENGTRMRMPASVVMDFDLYAGKDLSEEQLSVLTEAVKQASAKARAVRIISASSSSRAALRRKLVQKGEDPQCAQQAVQWLEDLHLLDDAKFACQVVQSAVRKGYGAARIKNILFEKQVPQQYWEQALALIPDMSDEIDAFLNKRFSGQQPDKKELDKAVNALLRRGHSWSDISSGLRRYSEVCREQLEDNDTYGI